MQRHLLALALAGSVLGGSLVLAGTPPAKGLDLATYVDLGEFYVKPVRPAKDPNTGFIVGGVNKTDGIKKLTEINGRAIAALEKDMRPKAASTAGFLGKDENLLDVMAADNKAVVD